MAKRAMDITLSFLGLLVLSPLLVLIAVLVKVTSAGPVFFAHHRERKNGRDFPCLKFRTMRADAHKIQRELYEKNEVDGPQFKMTDDPPNHSVREVSASHEHRRTAPVDQRASGTHEPCGTSAFAFPREPDLRSVAAGSAVRAAGGDRPVAVVQAEGRRGRFSRVDLLRHGLREALLLLAGSEDPVLHRDQ